MVKEFFVCYNSNFEDYGFENDPIFDWIRCERLSVGLFNPMLIA